MCCLHRIFYSILWRKLPLHQIHDIKYNQRQNRLQNCSPHFQWSQNDVTIAFILLNSKIHRNDARIFVNVQVVDWVRYVFLIWVSYNRRRWISVCVCVCLCVVINLTCGCFLLFDCVCVCVARVRVPYVCACCGTCFEQRSLYTYIETCDVCRCREACLPATKIVHKIENKIILSMLSHFVLLLLLRLS